jgi:hypothetical protein
MEGGVASLTSCWIASIPLLSQHIYVVIKFERCLVALKNKIKNKNKEIKTTSATYYFA